MLLHTKFLLIVLTIGWFARVAMANVQADLYVSPEGKNTWSGTLPQPNAGGNDGPLASLDAARLAVRQLRMGQPKRRTPLVVLIRGGTYEMGKAVTFGPADSGTEASPTVYRAYPGETPVFSGGRALSGWRVTDKGWWQVNLPSVKKGTWAFSQLFVNGSRRFRPRLPDKGYFHVAKMLPPSKKGRAHDRFGYAAGDVKADWYDPSNVEVVVFLQWTAGRQRIGQIDTKERELRLAGTMPSSSWWSAMKKDQRYLVENVREALGRPGQWYLDRPAGVLTYVPGKGETPDKARVVAPRLKQLVRLIGDNRLERWVSHLQFEGLIFAHTNFVLPAAERSFPQADVNQPAAIETSGARHCVFRRCAVRHTAGYGVTLGFGSKHCQLVDCELADLGAGGVMIGTYTGPTGSVKLDERTVASHNTVRNCKIAHGGRLHAAGIGMWIGHSHNNLLEHNDVYDFYYSSCSVGWTWGYGRSVAHHNEIQYNHMHTLGQGVLSDMGGVYTLGVSPGTVVRGNRIHDVRSFSYGGWGLYTDEGSTGIVMENNLVYRTWTGSFHQHYGKDNIIRNNILVNSRKWQIRRTRIEKHRSFTFTRNIVYWTTGPLLYSNWKDGQFDMDYNLYFNAASRPVGFAGMTLAQWRAKGKDVHSVIADPGFLDVPKDDYRLRDNSPALKLGFKPFDLSKAGRLKSATRRADLPAVPGAWPIPPVK